MHLKIAAIGIFFSTILASPTPVAEAPNVAPPQITTHSRRIPLACHTHTTSLYPMTCPDPRETSDCIVLPCIMNETRTLPCHTKHCPTTPTQTQWLPCPTGCRKGCETSTVYEKAICTA
ncbi:uncharacterized protein CIMG_00284 [Coccidioides immitis RS]|uniref:Uncharacterized protein n=3 Tax=Coccidioides immitis TaxID=5501 RepID=J3KGP0_COCIM|nr:uncharacterized protein CIMG_00284 [Coccidioides immitis RS]EAS34930.3 hypothetical protein CIMG_00284 [Coccidioides immitis RS]KMP00123.1 hypothetical protein CIRG_00266 [Coccidioides immitis RMSCC 2394]KMU84302.1 hypothetical protein CIHG_02090 [Coccidioides immitis H538.4]